MAAITLAVTNGNCASTRRISFAVHGRRLRVMVASITVRPASTVFMCTTVRAPGGVSTHS